MSVLNMVSTIKTSLAPILGQGRKHRSVVDVLNNSVNNGRQPIRLNPFFATLTRSALHQWILGVFHAEKLMGKLPRGSSKINRLSLNRCPPYTEIFSKRRKIYAVCVESLSMPTHWTKQWVVESRIQIRFVNTFFARTKHRLGTKWMWYEKATCYEMWDKDFHQEGKTYSAADQRPLCWLLSNCRWMRRAAARWNVFFPPNPQLLKPTREGRLGW